MRFIGCHGCVREGDVGVSVESGWGAVGRGGAVKDASWRDGCETHQLWRRC